jgi:hypothetical protein
MLLSWTVHARIVKLDLQTFELAASPATAIRPIPPVAVELADKGGWGRSVPKLTGSVRAPQLRQLYATIVDGLLTIRAAYRAVGPHTAIDCEPTPIRWIQSQTEGRRDHGLRQTWRDHLKDGKVQQGNFDTSG